MEDEALKRDTRFQEDLGADFLDLMEMIVAFGQTFDVRIRNAEVWQIKTVGQVVDYILTNSDVKGPEEQID